MAIPLSFRQAGVILKPESNLMDGGGILVPGRCEGAIAGMR